MSLLKTRDYYRPFEYPWMFDYYVLQNQMHWMPESVPLHTDVKDWQELTPVEKNLLTQIFRLFTQSDVDVGAFNKIDLGRIPEEYIKNEQVNTNYDLRSKFILTDVVDVMVYETSPITDEDIYK